MLLTIGMMVKNEEKHLKECLEALTPIREALDSELVIVDTGSDDNTVKIAKQFTDKVYFHEWNDNFSEMRNTVISYAKGDWFFTLDGDEVISNPETVIVFFKSGKYKKYNTAMMTQKNYTNIEENRFSKILQPRLFNNKDFYYEGAIHNQPHYEKPIYKSNTIIQHYGYVNSDPKLIERKFQRTSNILKEELEKDPKNIYYWFQLSKSYNMHKDQEDALETIEKAYEVAQKNNLDLRKRMYIYIQLCKMYLLNNRYKLSEKIAKEALVKKDGYVDLYYYLARAQLMQGKKEEALENFKEYINLINNYDQTNSKVDTSVDDETMGNYNIAYRFIVALAADLEIETDYAISSAFKIDIDSQLQHVIHPFISICLKNNRYIKSLEFYQKKLENEKIKQKFINLLEKLTANLNAEEKQQVYSQFTDLENNQEYNLLNKVRKNLYQDDYRIEIEDLKEIDYNKQPDYFGDIIYYLFKLDQSSAYNILTSIREENLNRVIKYLNKKYDDLSESIIKFIDHEIEGVAEARVNKSLSRYLLALDNDIDMDQDSEKIIDNYLSAGLNYIEKIYTEAVIKNELIYELKSKEEAFLLYIHKAFAVKDIDLKTYIKYLRKAIDIYPLMKKVVETLLLEIKNEQDQINKQIEAEKNKFKANIEELINRGSFKEAKELIEGYKEQFEMDEEIYSILSVIYIQVKDLKKAKKVIFKGLTKNNQSFDLLYNLAYIYEQNGKLQDAYRSYLKAKVNFKTKKEEIDVKKSINNISNKLNKPINITENYSLKNDTNTLDHEPFFIIGCGRSGSTLVRSVLNSHLKISIPPENIVLAKMIKTYNDLNFISWEDLIREVLDIFQNSPHFRLWEVKRDKLNKVLLNIENDRRTFRKVLDVIYREFAANKFPEAIRWGDKTPLNSLNINLIDKVFDNAKYIHLIRDGRDVVSSYLNSTTYVNDVNVACERWKSHINHAKDLGRKKDNNHYMEVYYEDFVSNPSEQTKRICNFIGVEYDSDMLNYHQNLNKLKDNKVKQHRNLKKPINTSSIGKWKNNLTDRQKKIVNSNLSDKLMELGYQEIPKEMSKNV